PRSRPRRARWKAWLWASTKPGICTGRGSHTLAHDRSGAIGECEARTQDFPVAVATGKSEDMASRRRARPSDYSRRGVRASYPFIVRSRIPNALTIARIFLIPVYVALITTCDGGRSWPAAIVFGVAGVTDQIDGFLARRWHVESAFGKIADPLADR